MSKCFDYNGHCLCQTICSGGSQQAQSNEIVKKNVDGTFFGMTVGTQIGSARAKGTDDGRRMGDVGTVTVVERRGDRFQELH